LEGRNEGRDNLVRVDDVGRDDVIEAGGNEVFDFFGEGFPPV
jgi:hypothetical protein